MASVSDVGTARLAAIDVPDLRHSFSDRRSLRNLLLTALLWVVALLASQFPEATGLETEALMYAAIVLLLISLAVNVLGTLIMAMSSKQKVG